MMRGQVCGDSWRAWAGSALRRRIRLGLLALCVKLLLRSWSDGCMETVGLTDLLMPRCSYREGPRRAGLSSWSRLSMSLDAFWIVNYGIRIVPSVRARAVTDRRGAAVADVQRAGRIGRDVFASSPR